MLAKLKPPRRHQSISRSSRITTYRGRVRLTGGSLSIDHIRARVSHVHVHTARWREWCHASSTAGASHRVSRVKVERTDASRVFAVLRMGKQWI